MTSCYMLQMYVYCFVINVLLFVIWNETINISFRIGKLKGMCKQLAYTCHGQYVFYIVNVTDSTCSISSRSRIVCVISSLSRVPYRHCHGEYVFYIVTVTDSTWSMSSLSLIVRVLYRHCHGQYLLFIVTVTNSTCCISSLSRVLYRYCHGYYVFHVVTVTDSTCISSLSRIVRVRRRHCHGYYVFYIVTVTDITCSISSLSRMIKTAVIHRLHQHSHCSSHGPHTVIVAATDHTQSLQQPRTTHITALRFSAAIIRRSVRFFLLQLAVSSLTLQVEQKAC